MMNVMKRSLLALVALAFLLACGGTPDTPDVSDDVGQDTSEDTAVDTGPAYYKISVFKTGDGGLVTSDPEGLSCGATCFAEFPAGSTVKLTATPTPGYRFAGFANACEGLAPCEVTLDAQAELGVTWKKHTLDVETAARWGGSKDEHAIDLAAGKSGDLLMTFTSLSEDFELGTETLPSVDSGVVHFVSVDKAGGVRFKHAFAGPESCGDFLVRSDAAGGAYLFGVAGPDTDLSGKMGAASHGSGTFLARYDADGGLAGYTLFEGGCITAAAVNSKGMSVITGKVTADTAEYGGEVHTTHADATSLFVAVFDATGQSVWSKVVATQPFDYAEGLDVLIDEAGEVTVAGFFQNTGKVDFGGGAMPDGSSIALVRYGPAGQHLWSRLFGGVYTHVNRFVPDGAGGLYVAGYESEGAEQRNFLTRIDKDGTELWRTEVHFEEKQQPAFILPIEGGVLLAGNTYKPFTPFEQFYLVRLTDLGIVEYKLHLGGDAADTLRGMVPSEEGLVLWGSTDSPSWSLGEVMLESTEGLSDLFMARVKSY